MTAEQKRVLSGRYHLVEPLGKGAMGSVWKAYDERLERTVAVKELLADGTIEEDPKVRRERVRREALALAAVEHPVVVAVHDLIYEGREKVPWIVMAYVSGRSLQRIVEKSGPLDPQASGQAGPHRPSAAVKRAATPRKPQGALLTGRPSGRHRCPAGPSRTLRGSLANGQPIARSPTCSRSTGPRPRTSSTSARTRSPGNC